MADLALAAATTAFEAGVSALVQSTIANAFAPDRFGPSLDALELQTSTEGAAIPIVYGRMRLAGQVIWAARFTEHASRQSAGGKGGGPSVTSYQYSLSFAVGLCEGPIARIGRVWANGVELDTSSLVMRVHTGRETQAPDALITAIEGAGLAPAYRGLAYVVFEDLPLKPLAIASRTSPLKSMAVRRTGLMRWKAWCAEFA